MTKEKNEKKPKEDPGQLMAQVLHASALQLMNQGRDVYHNHRTETHEHRAPTDESIRLLKEMESASEKKLIDCFKVEDNSLRSKWFVWENPACRNLDVKCVFVINGTEHTINEQLDMPSRSYSNESRREVIRALIKKISDKVTELLFKEGKFPLNIFGRSL